MSIDTSGGALTEAQATKVLWRPSNAVVTFVIFMLPALILFTTFVMLPMIDAAHFSLYKWNGYGTPTEFVGLDNFERLAGNRIFLHSFGNSMKIIAASLFIQLPVALILALLIYEKHWSNTVFRLIFFLPYILAEVASGLIWSFIFDGDYGLAAEISRWLHVDNFYILADRQWAFTAILTVIVWKYFGFHMMIYIAGLQSIPKDQIEAITIDGAGPLQVIRYVKLPMLKPALTMSVFFSVIGAMQVFDIIIPLTNGGPSNLTHSIVSFLYTFGLQRMNIGFGSAVGIVLFLFCATFAFTYRSTFQREKGAR
ncbi:carbohydrate ABC transporter permease [Martelella endophytica]|uniref:Sugar ABC transporter permease n=1 Tax=Martelella endophytica TaxID=1486262 RepID=A0A0D5LUV6_MAREN|nr:sugar ABC transporter permease [Martelella endophytica]AJY47826.1 sugar ABC transporter permease [Martelella endophytica]